MSIRPAILLVSAMVGCMAGCLYFRCVDRWAYIEGPGHEMVPKLEMAGWWILGESVLIGMGAGLLVVGAVSLSQLGLWRSMRGVARTPFDQR